MENKACNMFFQEDEEEYLDDPIRILDFEENTVFWGSENYFKNITIEDPGYVLNISLEDYEVRLQKSLLKLKELTKTTESSGYDNNSSNLFSKCRTCSIKVVDCLKFPWYYENKHGPTNKTQYPNKEYNVIEIEEEKDEEEIMIIDLTEKEDVEYQSKSIKIREENKEKIGKIKSNLNEFTSIDSTVSGKVKKQTNKTLSKPVLNIQKESHTKVPSSEVEQATDLIISTYTRLTDKAIQKLKSNIESCQNSTNIICHNLGNKLLLSSKNCTKSRDNLLQDTKYLEKVAKGTKDNINNNCKNSHHKKKNSKNSNEIKSIYTSEQISKTKIIIKKSSLKCKEIISSKNYYKEVEDKESNLSLNAINREQYVSLKTLEKKHNSLTNEKQQNNCENKQETSQYNSNLYALLTSPILTKKITKTKNSTSMPNRNIGSDRIHGCKKQLFSADRIIPHFHKNTSLNDQDEMRRSKTKSKYPKRPKETIHNYETKKLKNAFDLTEPYDIEPVISQISDPSEQQRIHDYCKGNNNATVNINELLKKNNNTKVDISTISAIRSVNPSQVIYNSPVTNEMIMKKSTHASPDVITENVNNIDYMSQSKKLAAQLEEERSRYLLPSNRKVPDYHIKNVFSYYSGSNLNTPPYI